MDVKFRAAGAAATVLMFEAPLKGVYAVVGIASLLVPDMKVAVPPVLADRELVLAHLRQLGSHRVPKTVPAQIRSQIHYTAPDLFTMNWPARLKAGAFTSGGWKFI
jgi:hypothetical protein